MSDFNVAIFSDRDFTQKKFINTSDPWSMNGERCVGGSTLSAYLFDIGIEEFAEKKGSFRGYDGACVALGVHFDFDGETAHKDVMDFITRTYNENGTVLADEDCQLWFSGSKGFHVLIGLKRGSIGPSTKTPDLVKEYAGTVAGRYLSWDSSVYDRTRGIRINNSRHQKSGLYKIELHPTELWTYDLPAIKKNATKPRLLRTKETISKIMSDSWEKYNG
jgi:hypothetical protein